MSANGDVVTMRFHEREITPYTNSLKINWNDVSAPTVTSASDFIDKITEMIQAGGLGGDPGTDGTDGTDGREIELQTNATHIQWRYVGEVSWTDLVALSTITGADGADGQDGRVIFEDTVTEVSGTATTTEELYFSVLIPGGTVVNHDSIDVEVMFTFQSTSTSQKQFYIKVHTSASTGGTIAANFQNNNSSGNAFAIKLKQDIKCKQVGAPATQTLETAYTNSAAGTIGLLNQIVTANIDLSADWYINFTAKKAVTGDTITLKYANVIVNKKV